MEEAKKKCFKCGLELPLSMFYAHPQMADGHLNKCKSCTKKDVHENYEKKINDDDFIEKQRARCREKYKRLEYGKKYKRKNHLLKTSNCRRKFERRFGKMSLPFKEGPSLGRMKALAEIVLNDQFIVRGMRIMESENGLYISYPVDPFVKGDDYKSICNPITRQLREHIENTVLEKYNERMKE